MGGRRGCRGAHAGELGVNKKGTPLYSREDIREQYCINDKELQVLDKSQRKSLLGCFSNQGQVIVHQKFHSKLRADKISDKSIGILHKATEEKLTDTHEMLYEICSKGDTFLVLYCH